MKAILTIRIIFILLIFMFLTAHYFPTFSTFERIVVAILFLAFMLDYLGTGAILSDNGEKIREHNTKIKELSAEIEQLKKLK